MNEDTADYDTVEDDILRMADLRLSVVPKYQEDIRNIYKHRTSKTRISDNTGRAMAGAIGANIMLTSFAESVTISES